MTDSKTTTPAPTAPTTAASTSDASAATTTPAAKPKKQERVKINQVFLCVVCGRAFLDRSAKEPSEITHDQALHPESVPHAKYPDDPDLARTFNRPGPATDKNGNPADAVVPEASALECCPTHTRLADSRHLSLTKQEDGTYLITGAKFIE